MSGIISVASSIGVAYRATPEDESKPKLSDIGFWYRPRTEAVVAELVVSPNGQATLGE